MQKEIEYKFLLKKSLSKKFLKKCNLLKIEQGYLQKNNDLRVRIVNKKEAVMTLKKGKGLVRNEYEHEIELNFAKELIKTSVYKLSKLRYEYVHFDGKKWELDYYPKIDLWVAEIELKNKKEEFKIPDFIGENVTGMKKYSNKKLAKLISNMCN